MTTNYNLTAEQEASIYGLNEITMLDADSEKITQPEDIKIPLKYHQLSLINYCQKVEKSSEHPFSYSESTDKGVYEYDVSSKNGIIGDIVGSGKTLSILGLISSTKDTNINSPDFENKDTSTKYCRVKCVSQPSLVTEEINISIVVVPHTIFKQWDKTVDEQTNLKYIKINNSKTLDKFNNMRDRILHPEVYDDMDSDDAPITSGYCYKTWDGKELEEYDMILISSTFYSKFMNVLMHDNFKVKRLVIDEADSIKIQGSYMIKNSFVWFVTSTFGALLNPGGTRMWRNQAGELSEYYSYSNGFTERIFINGITSKGFIRQTLEGFSYTTRKFRKFFVVKNNDDFVSNAFNLIPPKEHIIKCKMPLSLKILSTSASSEILAFINAGDIQGAVESLDCDKVSEEGVIAAVTKDLQNKLHNKILELEMKSKMNWNSEAAKSDALEKLNIKISEIKGKIDNIKLKLEDSSHCNICFDTEITCPTITPCCNTKFCFECITKWLAGNGSGSPNLTCPFCRAEISPKNLIVIDNNAASKCEKKKLEEELDKVETLRKILEERLVDKSKPLKILIFSEYIRAFSKMTDVLESLGIRYSKVIGTTNTINKKVREYKTNGEDGIDCLLLNAEYCASGLNLENTTDIIITHKMTNEKITQIVGRGQRPGRVGQLNVWKLFYETEM